MGDTTEQSKDVIGEKKQSDPGNKAPTKASEPSATLGEADSETLQEKQDTPKDYAQLLQEFDIDSFLEFVMTMERSLELLQSYIQLMPENQEPAICTKK